MSQVHEREQQGAWNTPIHPFPWQSALYQSSEIVDDVSCFQGLLNWRYHEEKLLFWCTRFTGISHLYDANASQKLSFTAAQSNAALEWIPKRVFGIKFARTPLCMLRLTFTLGKRNASSGAFRPESPFPIFVGVMYALERLIKISPSLRQLPRKVNCAWDFATCAWQCTAETR